MNHLLKYLSPFAPDQSGAVSALFELGGLIVICDAGGCTGNICGFDEPRWFSRRAALFSACLRDMDAIMGRDDRLLERLQKAAEVIHPPFTVLVGTPVPAVIATDFTALARLAEKRTGVPCLAIPSTGTHDYTQGAAEAFLSLFKRFATDRLPVEKGRVGYLGATPLDVSRCRIVPRHSLDVHYGMGTTLDDVRRASSAEKNVVLSPSGLPSAIYLERIFGTPFETDFPFLPKVVIPFHASRILVIHQQVAANAMREEIERQTDASVTVASWFPLSAKQSRPGDILLTDEASFEAAAASHDCIVADETLRHALPTWKGNWVDFLHFAVSGRLSDEAEGC